MNEPRLSKRDHDAWDLLMRQARLHARSRIHARRVDKARRIIGEAMAVCERPMVASSFGKDSIALTHLICVAMGLRVPVMTHRDDMDYPGSLEHALRYRDAWGLDMTVLTPPFSVKAWIAENAQRISVYDDLHSRASELARESFYKLVDAHNAKHDLVFLGLRAHESRARALDRAVHGPLYRKKATATHPEGLWMCKPLADWRGIDVYAYAVANDIELPPLYKCIGLMHRREPWRLRESWWLPERTNADNGGVMWLRYYYPSLYQQLVEWFPEAKMAS